MLGVHNLCMRSIISQQFGFCLIEVLVASALMSVVIIVILPSCRLNLLRLQSYYNANMAQTRMLSLYELMLNVHAVAEKQALYDRWQHNNAYYLPQATSTWSCNSEHCSVSLVWHDGLKHTISRDFIV